jgi:hypothetical protein
MERHYGVVCPDGKVMCDLCFGRFDVSELSVTADGDKQNVCVACALADSNGCYRLAGEVGVDERSPLASSTGASGAGSKLAPAPTPRASGLADSSGCNRRDTKFLSIDHRGLADQNGCNRHGD